MRPLKTKLVARPRSSRRMSDHGRALAAMFGIAASVIPGHWVPGGYRHSRWNGDQPQPSSVPSGYRGSIWNGGDGTSQSFAPDGYSGSTSNGDETSQSFAPDGYRGSSAETEPQ